MDYIGCTKEIETAFMVSCIKRLLVAGFTMQEIFDDLAKESNKMTSELTQEEQQGIARAYILKAQKGDK